MDFAKLKSIRKKRGYTLAQVSKAIGYTASYLSQLERGIKEPSISSLRKLANFYGIPLVSLFEEIGEDNIQDGTTEKNQQGFRIIRETNRKKVMIPELFTICEFITPSHKDKQYSISGHITKLEPGCWCSESLISHTTDESTYIIKGEMKALINEEAHFLLAGDSIFIQAHTLHNWQNCSKETLEVLTFVPFINEP